MAIIGPKLSGPRRDPEYRSLEYRGPLYLTAETAKMKLCDMLKAITCHFVSDCDMGTEGS
jgi:hypothetical protein